jgi:hypothetical protein
MNAETLRDGIFALNTRRFGSVAEVLIARMASLGKSRTLFHDLYDELENERVEVKFSRALKKSEKVITQESLLKCIEEATSLKRMVIWEDRKRVPFDCNIQQIKRSEFEHLYYGIFFMDKVAIFRIASKDIGPQIFYSDFQHKGNTGEGQFHINDKTIAIHEKHYLYQMITYNKLLELLTS